MTKDLFIESIEAIKAQFEHDAKCHKAFCAILPNDYVTNYDYHKVINQLLKLLQVAMNDQSDPSWIEYYIYELDFGSRWTESRVTRNGQSIKLETVEDLWNILSQE